MKIITLRPFTVDARIESRVKAFNLIISCIDMGKDQHTTLRLLIGFTQSISPFYKVGVGNGEVDVYERDENGTVNEELFMKIELILKTK